MFGFLKDKIKSWLGKSKETVESKASKADLAESKQKKVKETKKPSKQKEKAIKQEKKKRTKLELDQERKITDKVFEDVKKEGLELKSPEEKYEDKKLEIEKKAKQEAEELEIEQLQEKIKEQEQRVKEQEEEQGKDEEEIGQETKEPEKKGFFSRLKGFFTYKIKEDDFTELFDELEMLLLENNVALEVIDELRRKLKIQLLGKEMKKGQIQQEIQEALKKSISEILIEPENLVEEIKKHCKYSPEPYKILFFGINGAGKTTSIAKLCYLLQKNKLSCILAAADTFRAASIEQLEIHGNKLGVKVIKHDYGSDPSAVAFDAIKYAQANKINVVLIDTAGRMHTKDNLLKEMEKICRVTKPNLKVFVAEAVSGNDATEQAKAFNQIAGIDASILSKVDVDEKGGTILSIGYVTNKPILYLGVGQEYQDLELFNKTKFLERLGL